MSYLQYNICSVIQYTMCSDDTFDGLVLSRLRAVSIAFVTSRQDNEKQDQTDPFSASISQEIWKEAEDSGLSSLSTKRMAALGPFHFTGV